MTRLLLNAELLPTSSLMKYYPILLTLKDKRCVVIGGGNVATRKVYSLLKAGARVKIISPALTKGLEELKKKKKIFHIQSPYTKCYLKDAFLVIAATDSEQINTTAAEDANAAGVLINVVDSPAQSNFIVPSVIAQGDLIISISTSGAAPCLSKRMRKDLRTLLVPEYAKFLSKLKEIRKDIKLRNADPKRKASLLYRLVNARI